MALVRWEPARELNSLQQEMNRLFNTFFEPPLRSGAHNGGGPSPARWLPAMDLVESDDDYVLRADLPGIEKDDVKIELEDNVLTISGERRAEHEKSEEGFHRLERAFGTFGRSLTLPHGVDAQEIKADFENGVLEVRIPKPQERKPRSISIGVNGAAATIDGESQDSSTAD